MCYTTLFSQFIEITFRITHERENWKEQQRQQQSKEEEDKQKTKEKSVNAIHCDFRVTVDNKTNAKTKTKWNEMGMIFGEKDFCIVCVFLKIQCKGLHHALKSSYTTADFSVWRGKKTFRLMIKEKFEAHSKYRLSVEIDCISMWNTIASESHFYDLSPRAYCIHVCVCVLSIADASQKNLKHMTCFNSTWKHIYIHLFWLHYYKPKQSYTIRMRNYYICRFKCIVLKCVSFCFPL